MAVQVPPPKYIAMGGGGIPQIDAPTAASNAGERRVTISCGSSVISLPVTTETTPTDLLFSAANIMVHKINPKYSMITESYRSLFLERRLRRYELVKDVLNSWDFDAQNTLKIIPRNSASPTDRDLELSQVPITPDAPRGFSFYMYHSGRAGKWRKRFITLLETGQMYLHKKPSAKISDKDSTSLCHLSDFDIFGPPVDVGPPAWKVLKAPKRYCHAVKSLQKQAVFPNGENFVHFFCTDDPALAGRFYDAIHAWRSWYLVNKMRVVSPSESFQSSPTSKMSSSGRMAVNESERSKAEIGVLGHHRMKVSVDETPYTIGAFSPLMDMSRFDKPLDDFGKDFITSTTSSKSTRRETTKVPESQRRPATAISRSTTVSHRDAPTLSAAPPLPKAAHAPTFPLVQAAVNLYDPHINTPIPSTPTTPRRPPTRAHTIQTTPRHEPDFASSGLLGEVYEKRRAEQNSLVSPIVQSPFTEGPSLLNGGMTTPTVVTAPTTSLSRSKSTRVSSGGFHSHSEALATQAPPLPNAFAVDQARRGRAASSSINRSRSRGPMVKPLLDFDTPLPPTRPERPGNGVRAPAGVPLVDLAGLTAGAIPKSSSSGSVGISYTVVPSAVVGLGMGGGIGLGRANTVRSTGRAESRSRPSTSGGGTERSRSISGQKNRSGAIPPLPPLPHAVASSDPYGRRFH